MDEDEWKRRAKAAAVYLVSGTIIGGAHAKLDDREHVVVYGAPAPHSPHGPDPTVPQPPAVMRTVAVTTSAMPTVDTMGWWKTL